MAHVKRISTEELKKIKLKALEQIDSLRVILTADEYLSAVEKVARLSEASCSSEGKDLLQYLFGEDHRIIQREEIFILRTRILSSKLPIAIKKYLCSNLHEYTDIAVQEANFKNVLEEFLNNTQET